MKTDEPEIHDIQPSICARLAVSHKAFTKFRKELNGDGTIEYRVTQQEQEDELSQETGDGPRAGVLISPSAYKSLAALMDVAALDNVERPFFVLLDEQCQPAVAVDVVVGEAGDEGYCEHTPALVLEAARRIAELEKNARSMSSEPVSGRGVATAEPVFTMSRGHTHPVFYDAKVGRGYSSAMSRVETKTFGAMPSNIFGSVEEWRERQRMPSCTPVRSALIDKIIQSKVYKKHCEDYVESYYASHMPGFNAPFEGCASAFHWVLTPRLRQIGLFETPLELFGVVVYHPWHLLAPLPLEQYIDDDSEGGEERRKEDECNIKSDSSSCCSGVEGSGSALTAEDKAATSGAKVFWCMHEDCTTSVDSCFMDEEALNEHTRSMHS